MEYGSCVVGRNDKKPVGKNRKITQSDHTCIFYGLLAQLDRTCEIAGWYGIPVLEDGAEAWGPEFKVRKCGTFGELAALLFNGNKMITTSGGGALVCRSEKEAGLVKFYGTQVRESA